MTPTSLEVLLRRRGNLLNRWPALIYLFLAWLILRLTRRVSNGVIEQAEGTDDDDEAYRELQRALVEAEQSKDTDVS